MLDVWAGVDAEDVFDWVGLVLFDDVVEDVELELKGLELVFREVETEVNVLETKEDDGLDDEVEVVVDTLVDLLVVVHDDAESETNFWWF